MSKALEELHGELARVLAKAIKEGIPMKDDTTGEVTKAPAPAAILNVARQFLKDNNIQGTVDNPDITGIVEGLPDFSNETTYAPSAPLH